MQAATLPLPPAPVEISQIYTSQIAGSLYVGVLAGGNLYEMTGSGGTSSWTLLCGGLSLRDLRAHVDTAGGIHLFTLGTDNRVHHLSPRTDGGWMDAAPIRTGVARMTVGSSDGAISSCSSSAPRLAR